MLHGYLISLCFFAVVVYYVFFAVFLICIAIQLGYILLLFSKVFSIRTTTEVSPTKKPVSVIICAKNEADNLKKNLPSILAQRYTNDAGNLLYEVIVVNDASEDNTTEVLQELQEQYSHLYTVTINKDEHRDLLGKKFALGKGVEMAQYDVFLLTDADCMPASDLWLAKMVTPINNGKELVAGYGKHKESNGFLNAFSRWETIHTFLQYSSYAIAGIPYMTVGRNAACTRAAMTKAQSSAEWSKIPSGDDDLLIRAAGTPDNMTIVADSQAFTSSNTKESWADWAAQKQRHLSTGKLYKSNVIALLGFYASIHALTWLLFIVLMFTPYWQEALIGMAFRCTAYWVLWGYIAKRLQEKKIVYLLPILDFGWMLYNFAFSPYIVWKNKMVWK